MYVYICRCYRLEKANKKGLDATVAAGLFLVYGYTNTTRSKPSMQAQHKISLSISAQGC